MATIPNPSPPTQEFTAVIKIIGINPYVSPPQRVLSLLFKQACRSKGPIPIMGTLQGKPYRQTLMKYKGEWRLYVNTTMLKNSPKQVGSRIHLTVAYDSTSRTIRMPPSFKKALDENAEAQSAFNQLTPSRQQEIIRYLSHLKTKAALQCNIDRAIAHLHSKGRFVGHDSPQPAKTSRDSTSKVRRAKKR